MPKFIISILLIIQVSLASDSDTVYEQLVHFQESHDPGYIILTDKREFYFYYKGLDFKEVYSWKKNRPLKLVYSKTKGSILLDIKSKKYAEIESLNNGHLLDLALQNCLDKNQSTYGIAECYNETTKLYESEVNRLLGKIKSKYSIKVYDAVYQMQKDWTKYKESRYDVGRVLSQDTVYTMGIIESSVRALIPVKEQANFLESVYFYKY